MTGDGWMLLWAENLPPATWGALADAVRAAVQAVRVAHTGAQLVVGGVPADLLEPAVARALVGRALTERVKLVVLAGPPGTSSALSAATVGVASLASAAILAALAPGSAPHATAFTHVVRQTLGPMPLINTLHQLLAALANVAAVEGVPTDPDALVALTEHAHAPGEWTLLLPGVTEAVAAGNPADAFEEGETISVPLVLHTQLALAASLVTGIAARRDVSPQQVAAELLLGA